MAKEFLEAGKLLYDVMKHLTTLSTGSILVMTVFLEKFFKSPAWTTLIPITLIAFVASIVSSVVAMATLAFVIDDPTRKPDPLDNLLWPAFLASLGFFVAGVVCLTIFAIRNF